MRQIWILCGLLAPLTVFAGCDPQNGELASPPVGVIYESGDMSDTIDSQMGLRNGGAAASVGGGLGFAGEVGSNNAVVSCGSQGGEFRLRFVPRESPSPVLTLYLPEAHGGHGGHGGGLHGRAVVLRIEQGRVSRLTGSARVSLRAATHTAGHSAVSGTFTAEVGDTTLQGDIEGCYYFTG